MKIELFKETFELENNKESVDRLFDKIKGILEDGQYAIDCMEIDGILVHENHYEYIIENLKDINNIKISILCTEELVMDILASAAQYTARALPEISTLADEFYRGAEKDTWTKLQQLLEGIQWINTSMGVIAKSKSGYRGVHEYIKAVAEMRDKLSELINAVKNTDMVLIGDLLSYEFTPMLESIRDTANEIVNSEVDKDVSN